MNSPHKQHKKRVRKGGKRWSTKNHVHNWPLLKQKFLADPDISLNKFLLNNKVPQSQNTHEHTRTWIREKHEVIERAMQRAVAETEDRYVKEWREEIQVLKAIRYKVAERLKRAIDKKQMIKPDDLLKYMTTMEKNVKTHKLIRGEPTENVQHKAIHLQLIEINRNIEQGRDLNDYPFEVVSDESPKNAKAVQNKRQKQARKVT